MANIQTSDGVVRNLPDGAGLDSRQRIDVSGDTFGAQRGRAQQQGGQVLEKIGDEAFGTGEHFARVQVDDQFSKGYQDLNKHLDEYRSLEGRARLDARPRIEKAMEDSFKVYRDQLKLPFQQEEFDRKVLGVKNGYLNAQMSQLTEQADKRYKVSVAKAGIDTYSNMAALAPDDPVAVAAALDGARQNFVTLLEAEGNDQDDTLYDNAIASADRLIAKNVVDAKAVTNPKAALEYADAHKAALGHEYVPLANQLRARVYQQDGVEAANSAMVGAAQELSNPETVKPSGIRQAIYDQEGGPRTNPTQIQETTWDQWKRDGLVHEGERFGDPAAMQAVSDRALEKYEKDFKDPERVAVAWFSGPGNVAPAGAAQPFLEDRQDRNKKSVSSYVADIRDRLTGPKAQMYQAQASVIDKVLAATDGKPPEVRRAALAEVNQRFTAARTAALQSEAAMKAGTDSALRQYGDAVRAGQPGQPWRNDPRLTEAQIRDMDKYQQDRLKATIDGGDGTYGKGYDEAAGRIRSTGTDRIMYAEQLLPLQRSGQLTVDGYDEALKLLERYRKPGAEGERIQEQAFWDAAKKSVTLEFQFGEDKAMPVKPERMATWSKAVPVLNMALQKAREDGVPPQEIFDPESKRSVWGAVKPFLPTDQERQNATLAAAVAQDVKPKAAVAPFRLDQVKTMDEALQAWKDHPEIPVSEFQQLWDRNRWGKPSGAAPQVPTGP